jgi:L-threonylcarbamoyladenylate synthase
MKIAAPTPEAIAEAASLLRAGELVAIPTETVYGLGADARNPAAVAKIFAAKGRPADHPLIVHLPAVEHLSRWAVNVPETAYQLARAFWPGPLTLILERAATVPDAVTGGQPTVGLRIPAHPVALALLQAFDGGIAAPSANRFGRISPTTAAHVRDELGEALALVLDGGACEVGIESTILDLSQAPPVILRPGAISAEQIATVTGQRPSLAGAIPDRPRVSGSLAAHYAPRTTMRLCAAATLLDQASAHAASGKRVAVLARACTDPRDPRFTWHAAPADAPGYAHDLYAALRALDAAGADLILVETPPDDEAWSAVTDRLGRAQTGSGDDVAT